MSVRIRLFAAVILIAIAGMVYAVSPRILTSQPDNERGVPQTLTHEYTSNTYGLSFSYSDDYQLSESDARGSAMRAHHIIALVRKVDLPPPHGGEGPPAITIDIYQNNLDQQTTEGWIRNSSASNFKLSPEGRLASTTIDGKEALSFRWSGLYEGTTIALANSNWVYAFSVTYLQIGDPIVQDFVALRDSARIR